MKIGKKVLVLSISFIIVLFGCDLAALSGIKPVIDNFTASDTGIEAGESVTFTVSGTTVDDSVSSSTTDYGAKLELLVDGEKVKTVSLSSSDVKSNDIDEDITYTFEEAGEFDVKVKLVPNTGDTTKTSSVITITVEDKPVVYYTVSFVDNVYGNTDPADLTVAEGESVTFPSLEKDGYILDGWYKEITLENEWSSTSTVSKDITLYAKWVVKGSSFKYALDIDPKSSSSDTIDIEFPHDKSVYIKANIGTRFYISQSNPVVNVYMKVYDEDENAITIGGKEYIELPTGTAYQEISGITRGTYYLELYTDYFVDKTVSISFWE